MSYDLQVFAQQALTADDLRRLLAEAGLAVDDAGSATDSLTVVRGARAVYSFTLDLPVPIEAEDVPEEVTAVLLGPSYLYALLVEGSSATETPHAVRFARRLAKAAGGVVFDQQTDEIWARGNLRPAPSVQRGRFDVVEVHWYVRSGTAGATAARAWLELAARYLPEALPRRFGSYEPLPMKLDVDGPEAFVEAVTTETISSVSFSTSAPCIGGSLAAGADRWDLRSHGLSLHRGALGDPRWRGALQRLFVDFAVATEAVLATAQVQRGVGWSGRSAWYDATVEQTAYLAPRGRWMGLPPYPVWWSWFGPDYVPFVLEHLPEEQVVHVDGGVFHARGEEPLDRDQLTAALVRSSSTPRPRRTLRQMFSRSAPAVPWLPPELLPGQDRSEPYAAHPSLVPAPSIPAGLRPRG